MFFGKNIKYLRKKAGLNQDEMQAGTGIMRATWSDYERGHTEPGLDVIISIADYFNVSIDDLLRGDYEFKDMDVNLIVKPTIPKKSENVNLNVNPSVNLITTQGSFRKGTAIKNGTPERMPLVVTIDSSGRDNIVMVPAKVRAGYLSGYGDPEFISHLPVYSLPGLRGGTFRMFEVEGLSMYPTLSGGDIAICRNVEQLHDIRDDRVHVIVTKNEGLVIKRVLNRLDKDGKLILKSDNYKEREMYPTLVVDPADIIEVWYCTGYLSQQMRPPAETYKKLIDLEARLTLLEHSKGKNPTQL